MASTTDLYLFLEHNEANTRLIISQMAASPFRPNEEDAEICTHVGWILYQGWKKGKDEDLVS